MNEGETLKLWVQKRRLRVKDLAEALDVSESAIFFQYKKDIVSDSFKHKLNEAGYSSVFESKAKQTTEESLVDVNYKDKYLEAMEKLHEIRDKLEKSMQETSNWKEEYLIIEAANKDLKKKIKDLEKEPVTISTVKKG